MLGLQRRPTLDLKASNLHKLGRQNILYIESIAITIQEPIMYRKICIFVLFCLVSETLLHSYLEYICIM